MRTEQEIFELIENYLSGNLSDLEKSKLEESALENPSIAEQIDSQKMANEVIHFASLGQLRESIGSDLKNIPFKKSFNTSKILFYASIGILAIGISYFVFDDKDEKTIDSHIENILTEDIFSKNQSQLSDNEAKEIEGVKLKSKNTNTKELSKISSHIESSNIIENPQEIKESSIEYTIKEKNEAEIEELPILASAPPIPKEVASPVCKDKIEFETFASCKNDKNGKIQLIKAPKGSIFELKAENQTNPFGVFTYLGAKKYQIISKTPSGCTYEHTVQVEEKWCSNNENFSFNPRYGDVWDIKYDSQDKGQYQIFDSQGRLIKNGQFGEENISWNGKNINDAFVTNGIYHAMIKYENGRMEKIQITILAD